MRQDSRGSGGYTGATLPLEIWGQLALNACWSLRPCLKCLSLTKLCFLESNGIIHIFEEAADAPFWCL